MDNVLKKNFKYLVILQNANYIIPLFLFPYLTRTLGAENFGKITFVQAFITYFILSTDFGFNTSSTQEIVRIRDDRQALSRVFWSTIFTKAIIAGFCFLVMLILLTFIPRFQEMSLLIMIAFVGVISSVLFPVWLFQGLEKMSHLTWFNVIPKIFVLVFTLLFVKLKTDYLLALSIQTAGTLFSALVCAFYIFDKKIVRFYLPRIADIKSTIVNGWYIFISGVATNFYTTTNTVVLGFLTNDATVGIFSASEKIIRAVISLYSSVTQITFPRINSYYMESRDRAIQFGNKLLSYSAIITILTGIFLFLFSPLIVKFLFGLPQYQETINVMRVNSFLPFFAVCNGIMGVNFLLTFGLQNHLVKIVVIGCIFSLLLIVPAIMLYQSVGVAIVAIATEFLITLLIIDVLRKNQIELKIFNDSAFRKYF